MSTRRLITPGNAYRCGETVQRFCRLYLMLYLYISGSDDGILSSTVVSFYFLLISTLYIHVISHFASTNSKEDSLAIPIR